MKKLILTILLTNTMVWAIGNELRGKVQLDSNWISKVYLYEIQKYRDIKSGNTALIIDSAEIQNDGSFYLKSLEKGTLYRLMCFKKSNQAIIFNGREDNFIFVHTDSFDLNVDFRISQMNRTAKFVETNANGKFLNQVLQLRSNSMQYADSVGTLIKSGVEINREEIFNGLKDAVLSENPAIQNLLNSTHDPIEEVLLISILDYGNNLNTVGYDLEDANRELNDHRSLKLVNNYLTTYINETEPLDYQAFSNFVNLVSGQQNFIDDESANFLIFDFWASWCVPCREFIRNELPNIKSRNKDLGIVGVNLDKSEDMMMKAMKADGNTEEQIWISENFDQPYIKDVLQISNIPLLILVDKKQKKVTRYTNVIDLNL